MIDRIRLKNFKCFRDETIRFGGLTILSGLNGAGKSSVIQAVLALRQRMGSTRGFPWRGSLVNLGSFRDVLHCDASDDAVRLEASFFEGSGTAGFEEGPHRRAGESETTLFDAGAQQWFKGDVFYLSADRHGPRNTLPYLEEGHASATPLGTRGEHVLWYLDRCGHSPVHARVRHPAEPKNTLAAQTSAWLSVISPGAELQIKVIPEADLAVAAFRYARPEDVPSSPFRPENVGFGLSYGLPPIVALLAPKRVSPSGVDQLVIIENPEAHLHPAGQTSMAELASRAVAGGAQVILETHSDHVLNGVRLAVRDNILSADQVAIHYFEREGLEVRVTTPVLASNGKLDIWPVGFFDQHERNLSLLIGLPVPAGDSVQVSR